MKTLYKLLGIILLSVVIFSGCNENMSDSSSVSGNHGSLLKGLGPSASGQGRIVGSDRVFAFNVITHPNGVIQGQGTLNRTDISVRFKFNIDCLTVNDNVATMSGTITDSNIPEVIGAPCWFRVKDNGEGSNAPPDEITYLYYCPDNQPDCEIVACGEDLKDENGDDVPLIAIEEGNIQVMD